MQTDQLPSPPARTQWSAPSLACDLSWVLSVASGESWRATHPVVADLFVGHDDLLERVRTFWAEERPVSCFTETLVLAHHAGVLAETSPAALWAAIESAVQTVPTDLALASESAEERAVFLHRLQRLQESPELTRAYVGLLSEVWALADTIWQSSRATLEESGQQVLQLIQQNGCIPESMARKCDIFRETLPDINARVDAGQPLIIVPCLFFGNTLYLELPGLTLVGSGLEHKDVAARARTESLARRLKTVADPTRLALLHFLATSPSTVGQLATSFGLAQPTVSMHVKSLRQAGLVRSERKEGRMQLSAEPDAVDALVDELRRVTQGASTTGNFRMPATVVEATRSAAPVTA
jgi:ArsR family transcriptional regulator, arsenate/arsenite/antimonite-responsive transcriptional repressor